MCWGTDRCGAPWAACEQGMITICSNAAAEWAEGNVQLGPAAILLAASKEPAGLFFQQPGTRVTLKNWILPVVLSAGLATISQLLANHLQLQSCSLAIPRLSYITKVLPVKGRKKERKKACARPLSSTTFTSHPFTVCSLLIKCAGPYSNREGNGDRDPKTLS